MSARHLSALGAALTVLGGCVDTPATQGKSSEVIRADSGCEVAGLAAPLRQTVVFLDARAIQRSADARDFAEKNGGIRDILLSIADPNRIQSSGVSALRERISIAIVPVDGTPAQLIFTGCPPGLSASELAAARSGTSKAAEFFTGDLAGKLAGQADAFNEQLIGALTAAGNRAAGGDPSGSIAAAPFLSGVRTARALLDSKGKVLRLVLVSDVAAYAPAGEMAEGLAAGRAAGGQFNLAEAHLVVPAGKRVAHQPFLRGWLLGQNAQLLSAGAGRIAVTAPPPQRLWRLEGQAAYPQRNEPVAMQLGDDGAGKLSDAWLVLRGTPDRATPMTGSITCTGARCAIQSDDGGFAQAWNPAPSATPKFDSEWPFAGMRSFAFQLEGDRLSGQVFDDGVYIGDDTNKNSIKINAAVRR